MLFGTHEPWKYAFSQESSDLNDISCSYDSNVWGIIGVPFDSTSSYHVGSRYGPLVIREASFNFEHFDVILDSSLDCVFYDFGDLNIINGNCKKTCDLLEVCVGDLCDKNIKPLILGGEHSVSLGSLRAIADNETSGDLSNITIVHMDAHRDIIDSFETEKEAHTTVMRRAFELNPKQLIQIGIRSSSSSEEDFVSENCKITSFLADECLNNLDNVLDTLKEINGSIYISIDLDVLDPSFAPGVGNPVPCGLSPNDISKILKILTNKDIIGFDLVETGTSQLGDITAINASKIVHDFLTLIE